MAAFYPILLRNKRLLTPFPLSLFPVEVVVQNGFACPLDACHVERLRDGSNDQDHRDHHHDLQQRETPSAMFAHGIVALAELAD